MDTTVAELRAEIARLQRRVDLLAADSTEPDPDPHRDAGPAPGASRRRMLALAGATAAGGLAALAAGRPVAADDPNDLELGAGKSTNGLTAATYTGSATTGVAFRFSSTTGIFAVPPGLTAQRGTLAGFADGGLDHGVDGGTAAADGYGVLAHNYAAGGRALRAECFRGTAITGHSTNNVSNDDRGIGVNGIGNGVGVLGEASPDVEAGGGVGVFGTGRVGVRGNGDHYSFDAEDGRRAQLWLRTTRINGSTRTAPPTRSDLHEVGEIETDAAGNLWYCVNGGTPGDWRRLSGPATAGSIHLVRPFRVYDSRFVTSTGLAGGSSTTVSVADAIDVQTGAVVAADAVPVGARGVTANVTLDATVGGGYVTVNPGGDSTIGSSAVNWSSSGTVIANAGIFALSAGRELQVLVQGGRTQVIIDITGFLL